MTDLIHFIGSNMQLWWIIKPDCSYSAVNTWSLIWPLWKYVCVEEWWMRCKECTTSCLFIYSIHCFLHLFYVVFYLVSSFFFYKATYNKHVIDLFIFFYWTIERVFILFIWRRSLITSRPSMNIFMSYNMLCIYFKSLISSVCECFCI